MKIDDLTNELRIAKEEVQKLNAELLLLNNELELHKKEKTKRAEELGIANIELAFQDDEKVKRSEELGIANIELAFQQAEKKNRAAELVLANKELVIQNREKENNAIILQNANYARSLIEASLDPFVTINALGKVTDVNQASIHVTGVERDKLIGTNFSSYFTNSDLAEEAYRRVFEKSFVADYPLTIKHIDGKLTDVLYNASIYKDPKGNVIGVFAAARDVTKQKVIESNLNKSLKEISAYKLAMDASSIIATTDRKGIIKSVNDNFCKISKYTRDELIGKDHNILNSKFHSNAFMKELWDTINSGNIWHGEIRNRAKDGTIYWVDSTIVPFIDDDKKIYQFVAIRTDITAKKLLSQYSRSLIEASHDPLITISTEGKITDVNEAMVNVTGQTRDFLINSDFKNYFTDSIKASEVYEEVFAKGFVVDYPLTIMDGKLTDVLFNGAVYKDDRGNVIGAVIVARDITEQKRIEQELREAKIFAENAVKAKQQFLSNMSHEIRTPMNAIIGFTKVILKTELTIKQREYLDAIKLSGDSLIVLINDILDLAKVDSGKMTFEQAPFKLAASISAMIHLFETKIQEKNIDLITEYDNSIPNVLMGDSVRLHQIIMNLVSNAVKFTNKGQIKVIVKLIEQTSKYSKVKFSVSDTGIGISPLKIDTIFENFQQASSSTSRLFGGTGLGLAIVKQLVEQQNGFIEVESKVDVGSVFSFTLSFLNTTQSVETDEPLLEINSEVKKIKILVVEDMALNQLLMKTLLDEFGFERDIASNGKIAIEMLKQKVYDIILMDLQMPIMNGFEATDYIRNELKLKIPIIALTADVTTVDLDKCRSVGMNDYIAKPVDERILYNKIIGLIKKQTDNSSTGLTTSTIESEQRKYINLNFLNRRTKSNPILMMEMIGLYLEQIPPLVDTMKQSLLQKDWDALYAAVHKMIPSFSIVGISNDYEKMAQKVQEFASTQQQYEGIHDMVAQLEEICIMACKELEEEYKAIKNKQK